MGLSLLGDAIKLYPPRKESLSVFRLLSSIDHCGPCPACLGVQRRVTARSFGTAAAGERSRLQPPTATPSGKAPPSSPPGFRLDAEALGSAPSGRTDRPPPPAATPSERTPPSSPRGAALASWPDGPTRPARPRPLHPTPQRPVRLRSPCPLFLPCVHDAVSMTCPLSFVTADRQKPSARLLSVLSWAVVLTITLIE